jgi:hypothetical protein
MIGTLTQIFFQTIKGLVLIEPYPIMRILNLLKFSKLSGSKLPHSAEQGKSLRKVFALAHAHRRLMQKKKKFLTYF